MNASKRLDALEAAHAPPAVDLIRIVAMTADGYATTPATKIQAGGAQYIRDGCETEGTFIARVRDLHPRGIFVMF